AKLIEMGSSDKKKKPLSNSPDRTESSPEPKRASKAARTPSTSKGGGAKPSAPGRKPSATSPERAERKPRKESAQATDVLQEMPVTKPLPVFENDIELLRYFGIELFEPSEEDEPPTQPVVPVKLPRGIPNVDDDGDELDPAAITDFSPRDDRQ